MDISTLSARLDNAVYAGSVYPSSPLPRLRQTEWPRWLPTCWHSHREADIKEKWPLFLVDDLQAIGQGDDAIDRRAGNHKSSRADVEIRAGAARIGECRPSLGKQGTARRIPARSATISDLARSARPDGNHLE